MSSKQKSDGLAVDQGDYVVPNITIKELLDIIPPRCFKRSTLRSSSYVVWDIFVIGCTYKAATFLDTFINPTVIELYHPFAYRVARFALWSLYGFWAGLFATGLWVIGHECGHQAFSESKIINNLVGWFIHSALGVPFHAWRITHGQHHAMTGHMTNDQVFVPHTRSDRGLPPLDPSMEDPLGSHVTGEVMKELWEALGDSPVGAVFNLATYLLVGWPAYLIQNASGQSHYPKGTNHFDPSAVMFKPHQFWQVVWSNIGIAIWIGGLTAWASQRGFWEVLTLYIVPYLWVNHWLVLITFLQHTDPLLPHYRAPAFTFSRGALATLDRNLLGNCGKLMGWIGAHATHGISETHVSHHICSKIPHYNAWEASAAMKKFLASHNIQLEGAPGCWAEAIRVFKECKFVEDEGDVVFFKNAFGLAKLRPIFIDNTTSDSGIELENK